MTLIFITNGKNPHKVVEEHIQRLNNELNARIKINYEDSWEETSQKLKRYLIDHRFNDFEGVRISDETIGAFIDRIKHDDSYLKYIKHSIKPNAVDKYDEFLARRAHH